MTFRLLLPTLILSFAICFLGFQSYNSLTHSINSYSRVSEESLPNIQNLEGMFLEFKQVRIGLRTLGLEGITSEEGFKSIAEAEKAIAKFEEYEKKYLAVKFVPGEQEKYELVRTEWESFKKLGGRVITLFKADPVKNRAELQHIFFVDCPKGADAFAEKLNDLVEFNKNNAAKWSEEAKNIAANATKSILYTSVTSLLLGLGMMAFSLYSILKLMSSIKQAVSGMRQSSQEVEKVTGNLSNTSETLSSGAVQQAAAVQQTSSALEETSSMVKKNSDNADRCQEYARDGKESIEKGRSSVQELQRSINSISESNEKIAQEIDSSQQEMRQIVNTILEIENKTKVINEIVFQTKLLSFNASVEAARAGEHGKGFAVVADEVGDLAEMSGKAAKEISSLLEMSVKKVEDIATAMKSRTEAAMVESKQKISHGNLTSEVCITSFDEIVEKVDQLDRLIVEIASASKEQANGVSEINKAISEIDSGAQSFSRASSETSTDAKNLQSQVEGLATVLNQLSTIVGINNDKAA